MRLQEGVQATRARCQVATFPCEQAGMAADWFHRLGYTLPYGTNVADYILDLGSGTVLSAKR